MTYFYDIKHANTGSSLVRIPEPFDTIECKHEDTSDVLARMSTLQISKIRIGVECLDILASRGLESTDENRHQERAVCKANVDIY